MEANKLTTKSQEALSAAVRHVGRPRATRRSSRRTCWPRCSRRPTAPPARCCARWAPTRPTCAPRTTPLLGRLPSASGATVAAPQFSRDLHKVLTAAAKQAEELRDEYVSTEHLLVGLAADGGPVAELLRRHGATAGRAARGVPAGPRLGPGHHRRTPRAPTRRWRSTASTSPPRPATASSTRSSAGTPRSAGSCRCCPGGPRTTRCSSASPASARPRSSRAWPSGSWPATCRSRCGTSGWSRSTSARWSPARSTAASSRSGSRPCSTRSRSPTARSSRSSTSCTRSSARARPRARWTRATCSSRCWPAASCGWSARPRWTSTGERIEKDPALERRFQQVLVGEPVGRGHDRDPARAQGPVRGAPPGADRRLRAGRRRDAVRPLHHRPVPAGQGHRPGRRVRVPAADGDRLPAGGDRRAAARGDRLKMEELALAERDRRGLEGAAGAAAPRPGRPAGAAVRADRPLGAGEDRPQPGRRAEEAARRPARPGRAGAARGRPRPPRRSCCTGRSRQLEKELAAAALARPRTPAATAAMVKEEVGPDDVADVVSAWTGIPAGRLLEGETAKLLRMEDELGRRVVGQPRGRDRGLRRGAPGPGGRVRPGPADRLVPVPRPDRRRQDRAGQGAGRLPVRRRAGDGPHRHERVLARSTRWPGSSAPRPATSATSRAAS